MGRLDGRIVVITGAGGGQGAVEAEACADEGAIVVATDVDGDAARAVAARVDGLGFGHDVAHDDAWHTVIEATVERFGRIDGLVNNAGIFSAETLLDGDVATTRRIIEVNQIGTYLGMKRTAPAMTAGGSIVNIASIGGMRGYPAFAYASSKWAVRGMTRSAARELAPMGIRVNAVCPGLVDTPMIAGTTPERRRELEASTPLGRIGLSDDIAAAVVFLLSDDSSYMTGTDVVVDGGLIA